MNRRTLLTISFVVITCFAFAESSKTVDSLETQLGKAKGTEKVEVLRELSLLYLNDSPKKAFETAHKAVYFSSFINSPELLAETYFTLGMLHFRTSSFDSAKTYMNQALKVCETNALTAEVLDNLGVLYKDLSRYDSAIVYHNQALSLQKVLGNREAVATCYKNIGNVYMQMAKYDDALDYYTQSYDEYNKDDGNQKEIASLYNSMSAAYVGLAQYSKALSYAMEAVDIQLEVGDRKGEAYTLNGIGNFYFRLKIYDKAQEYYTKSLDLRQLLGDKNDIAASQFNIATVHRDLGNYKEALKYYEQALEFRRQTHNKEAEALILNAIGGTYKNQKNYAKAIETYQSALTLNEKIGGRKNIASSYERLGMVYRDTCLYDKAAHYYAKAIGEYQAIGDSLNVGRMYNFYGNLNKDRGDVKGAENCYENAIKFYRNNMLGVAYVVFNRGKLAQQIGSNAAEKYYTEALNYAEKSKEKTLMRDVLFALYSLKKQNNNADASLRYYERYVSLKDSIESDKNKERIAELEFENDIKLLEHVNENQELRLQEDELKNNQFRVFVILLCILLFAITGFAFILYRQYLQKKNANALLVQKQSEIEFVYGEVKVSNEALQKKNTQILDSLMYANRIQKAILPSHEQISSVFPKNFILYLPKEIVSGDFYWLSEIGDYVFFAVVDCTGHGVPGACMSMMANTMLNQIVNESKIYEPGEILNQLDREVIKTLHQDECSDIQEDGMAISLIRYNKKKSEVTFASAGQKVIVYNNGEPQTYGASLCSIGGMHAFKQTQNVTFEETTFSAVPGTTIYLFSDGFVDQFGGEKKQRFSTHRFSEMLMEMQPLDMPEQFLNISRHFDTWKGNEKQIDDILVVGIQL